MTSDERVARRMEAVRDDIWAKLILEGWFSVPHRPQNSYGQSRDRDATAASAEPADAPSKDPTSPSLSLDVKVAVAFGWDRPFHEQRSQEQQRAIEFDR